LTQEPEAVLYADEMLDEMAKIPTSKALEEQIRNLPKSPEVERYQRPVYTYPKRKIIDFLLEEGIAAIASRDGMFDDGTVQVNTVAHEAWAQEAPPQPTSFVLAAEHYNRILRILEKDIPVELEVELRASYTREDLNGHNVIAEIQGADLADEVVIVAAHYDGCIGGTEGYHEAGRRGCSKHRLSHSHAKSEAATELRNGSRIERRPCYKMRYESLWL
jgi:hypothetical protein